MRLVECVPNVSEGRDETVVRRLVGAVETTAGLKLLDWSADRDHNRTVLTYVGEPEAVFTGTQALCREAFASIDMRHHQGAHPRLGAVDVIPLVPLRGVTGDDTVALARRLGAWIGKQGVPVYYYADAATRPERESLPEVRRGQYEGLAARMSTPEGAPDEGPGEFNAKSGASIVGVRFPLVAFNVNLDTADLSIAKRIAETIRHSSGGFRYVRAMGVELADKGQVQVSIDFLQYEKTPLHRVLETIRSEAARHGVAVAGCELVGLAPLAAFEETIAHYLQLHGFSVRQVLENRLLES
jgi:glutamate formiminotransferase